MDYKMEEGELVDSTGNSGMISRKLEQNFGKRPYSDGSEEDIDELAIRPPPVASKKHKRHHKKKSKEDKKEKRRDRERSRSPLLTERNYNKNHVESRRFYESSSAAPYGDNGSSRGRHNERTSSRERYGRDKSRDYRYKESSSSRNYNNFSSSYQHHSQRSRSRNDDYKSSKSRRTDSRPVSPLIKRVEVDTYGQGRTISDRPLSKNHSRSKTATDVSQFPARYQEAATSTKSSRPRSAVTEPRSPKNYSSRGSSKRSSAESMSTKYSSSTVALSTSNRRKRDKIQRLPSSQEESSAESENDSDRKQRRKHKKSKRREPSLSESESSEEVEVEDSEEDSEEDSSSSSGSDDNADDQNEEEGEGNSSSGASQSLSQDQNQFKFKDGKLIGVRSKFDSSSESEDEDEDEAEQSSGDDHIINNDGGGLFAYDRDPPSPELLYQDVVEHEKLPWYYPARQGCRNVDEFACLNRIEEGTYGVVYRAKEKSSNKLVALKRLKMEKEKEGFPITSLREVNTLAKACSHRNIVKIQEVVVGSNVDKIYIVMEYVEHDLKTLMETMASPFLVGEVKTLICQLLSGVRHLHDNWILHRDLKTSNLLLSHKGILKIGDFGLAREYGSPLRPYTPVVVTLWYRCPELLLGQKEYSCAVDMWSVGCILAELVQKDALFKAKSEILQLHKIYSILGTPNEEIWPGYNQLPLIQKTDHKLPANAQSKLRKIFGVTQFDHDGMTLLKSLLTYDPTKRMTAADALKSPWFYKDPRPVPPESFPTWPAKSELALRKDKHATSSGATPKAPSGGGGYSSLLKEEDGFKLQQAPKEGASKAGQGFFLKF